MRALHSLCRVHRRHRLAVLPLEGVELGLERRRVELHPQRREGEGGGQSDGHAARDDRELGDDRRGGAGDEAGDSASEYVILTPGGNVASVVDQGFGIGLMLLGDASLDQAQGCACQVSRLPGPGAWLCVSVLALVGRFRRREHSMNA